MDAAQRQLYDQIDDATQRLLGTVRIITEPDLREPSLLPGWTRARVAAHLARGADAMRNLLVGARSGQDRPAYASSEARETDVERGAAQDAKDLAADVADSAMALRTVARRLVEVELHHCDLAAGYGPADWPDSFACLELEEPMATWRQDRLSWPQELLDSVPPLRPARVPPRPRNVGP